MQRCLCLLIAAMATVMCGLEDVQAQGTRSDYERANSFRSRMSKKVFKASVNANWFAENTRFWYRNDLSGGRREFAVVDAAKGKRQPAFDHARLAASLGKATERKVDAERLPIDAIEFDAEAKTLRIACRGKGWTCDLRTYELAKDAKPIRAAARRRSPPRSRGPSGSRESSKSPDRKWVAFIKDHNLFIRQEKDGREVRLTKDGKQGHAYRSSVSWSPDSKKLVSMRVLEAPARKVYLVESSPPDQLQPKLHSYEYRKPGDPIPISKPHLFDVEKGTEIAVSDELFKTPWRLSSLRWSADSSRFTFLYNQRGHQAMRVVGVDGNTGGAQAIVDERTDTFIDYAHKTFLLRMEGANELIWMSERDGWNHLYLYDMKTGKVKKQITKGDWLVRGVEHVDDQKRQLWLRIGGYYANQDPYYVHYARVNFDGTGFVVLTEGDGTHEVEFSPDRKYLIDTYSRVNFPPVTELRNAETGKLICKLEKADISQLLKAGWKMPERFVAKGRDGKTDIYGIVYRPTNFDPKRKYPIIEHIYAGPQGQTVRKRFSANQGSAQPLAELGFITVHIDGMGTNWRSRAFHDVCWKNLGDAGLPDRKLWITALAKKYAFVDLSHVGVYGGSAGGQNALGALLFHPDFYHVAVADSGCHDNRMDKIWWNEAWMGWPVGDHYAKQSNVTNAYRLKGKLLLIVGELDHNVDPSSTMQVVNALIKADKDFDLLVIPGGGHGVGGAYGSRRRMDFFVRHLLGVEPRSEQ